MAICTQNRYKDCFARLDTGKCYALKEAAVSSSRRCSFYQPKTIFLNPREIERDCANYAQKQVKEIEC